MICMPYATMIEAPMSHLCPIHALAALILGAFPAAAQPCDDPVVGITQIPATMHPATDRCWRNPMC